MKAAWGKFGIEVWSGAGKVKDRTEIVELNGVELEDDRRFSVNTVVLTVKYWINLLTIHTKT